jgi:hypothetical protein
MKLVLMMVPASCQAVGTEPFAYEFEPIFRDIENNIIDNDQKELTEELRFVENCMY